ncbi:ATP-binding cassette domain-containing protein, partial [bacterium]|nr:ATP-binding cassette domain-containing protein [bacterium]
RRRSYDLLARVGLSERLQSFPAQLSGGERQRVAVARALMNEPRLLLCDEPTGNLDQATGAEVVALLLELARSDGLTVVMVTHNPAHAAACQAVYELREGRLAPSGGPR